MSIINGLAKNSARGFYPRTINQSLRFNDNDSAYLSRTPASAGNRKTWTFSAWVKRGNLDGTQPLLDAGAGSPNNRTILYFGSGNTLNFVNAVGGTSSTVVVSSAVFRDVGSWYHIQYAVDTTQATASDRVKIYVNGIQLDSFSTGTYPAQDLNLFVNSTDIHKIGNDVIGSAQYYDGYLAEVHFTDGTAYDATAFGEFKSGVWVAKTPDVTYGANGFYLDFADGGAIGNDVSGNNNDWTANNLAATDVMLDSPTNNFATLNNLTGNQTLLEGNLRVSHSNTTSTGTYSTISTSSGKWYFETTNYTLNSSVYRVVGLVNADTFSESIVADSIYLLRDGTYKINNGTAQSYASALSSTDVIGVAFDVDAKTCEFYINGTGQGSIDISAMGDTISPVFIRSGTLSPWANTFNFGQDSSFAGNKTPQGNTDANGRGDFYYAPPSGYLALCTQNLPEPAISPADDASPSDHFNVVTYTGNASSISVTGVGFSPDLVWGKSRAAARSHGIFDRLRGVHNVISSNATAAEGTNTNTLTSFDADGFSSGSSAYLNAAEAYVAWSWKADNTSGSTIPANAYGGGVPSISSIVAANTEAGFSIVSYNSGNSGTNETIAHGLGVPPAMVIVKDRGAVDNWMVWHKEMGATLPTQTLFLNATNALFTSSTGNVWGTMDSSIVTIGDRDGVNNAGESIMYVFAEVSGYSKFGSYTGNGSADGPFVYTGFRPAFVMVKRTDSTGSWGMLDADRDPYNEDNAATLYAENSAAEVGEVTVATDFLSNGFKPRGTWSGHNTSGGTYIYMAFAENPFKYSTAR